MSSRGLRVIVLSRSVSKTSSSQTWGLGQDSKIVEQVLREVSSGGTVKIASVEHLDPMSFFCGKVRPHTVDLAIHLEVPCRAAWRWASRNIVVVNPEWWPSSAWNWVLAPPEAGGADTLLFKSEHALSLFPEVPAKRARVLTWRAGSEIQSALATLSGGGVAPRREFLYLIGASTNKLNAARVVCKLWRASWPRLLVVGTESVLSALRSAEAEAAGVAFQPPFATDELRIAAQAEYAYHVVASEAEGFGYTFAEAAALGALPLWTNIPVYAAQGGALLKSVGRIEMGSGGKGLYRDAPRRIDRSSIERAVTSLLSLSAEEERGLRGALRHAATTRVTEFRTGWKQLLGLAERAIRSSPTTAVALPPAPPAAVDLPHVAVVTLTRNRPQWFANMARNLLLSDYPSDKLTWIVADDGDGVAGRVDAAIAKFQSVHTRLRVRYLSLPTTLPIGAKRNKACEAAPPDVTVFVMMDDDDHYPAPSIATRVAWLSATKTGCVYCSTLPMYHCGKYISAINVPPLDLAPEERVSEATLCFTRAFWEARKFPGPVSVAEGEAFLEGRAAETAEIPPEGVIVSFLHGSNATSRRVPADTEPNGCHYGFDDEYFSYLSRIGEK